MGEMTKSEIRAAFHETVDNRVPYYGEYMIQDDDGEWTFNEEYIDA
jgi:cyclic pyranopterin phosphate synthase